MPRMVLEFHDWRENKPDDENEIKALFLFTLLTAAEKAAGVKADHTKAFWTEVRLSRDLSSRGRWASLSKADKIKFMFRFAQERIQEGGRKLREAPMFWTATSPWSDGPPWDLNQIKFPKADPLTFEAQPLAESPYLADRKAAGLTA